MKTVLIVCGGVSEEHEISLISAKGILDALDRTKFAPVIVTVTKKGEWLLQEPGSFFVGEFRADRIALNPGGQPVAVRPSRTDHGRGRLEWDSKHVDFDAVFPIVHGQFGEDGTLQGMLELIGIPYVGSGCGPSALCMDKVWTKIFCERAGVKVAEFVWLSQGDDWKVQQEAIQKLGFPLFVKPSRQGSSVGVSKVKSASEIDAAVKAAFQFDTKVLIERGIPGREIECAVLGTTKDCKASRPGEIIPDASIGWYSYDAKYLLADGAKTVTPAEVDPKVEKKIQEFANKVFRATECFGLARVDMFLTPEGSLYLNEVNTIPGFTPISMYPKMWEASGLKYKDLITQLLLLAFERTRP